MNRMRRWLLLSVITGTSLSITACQKEGAFSEVKAETSTVTQNVDIGLPPYKKQPFPTLAAAAGAKDPIIVPNAVVKFAEKQLVPAQVDGYIELVALELAPGTKYDPNNRQIVNHPRDKDKKRLFRQITPGMPVNKYDVVAWLDESQVEANYLSSKRIIEASQRGINFAKSGLASVKIMTADMEKLFEGGKGAIAKNEYLNLLVQESRFQENLVQSEQNQLKAQQEYETAESLLRKHRPIAAVTGKVTNVFKRPGEYAKAGEPILEIQSSEEVIIEGELPIQYVGQVKPGSTVRIESTRPIAEDRNLGSISHRREVTGVAVTSHPGRPLVVSGGMDGVALVWEPFAKKLPHSLPHPVGVKAVAVSATTPAGTFAATGGEDGKVRVWNLTNPDKLPSKIDDAKVSEEGHSAAITALAFSPDGKMVASAAGREVIVWEASTGKKIYSLPAEHKDSVTALRFTPQCTLVTVCRDKAVRTWNVGAQGASLDRMIDHRAGVVDHLAVTSDGGRVLFDQDEGRIDLVSLADGQSVGTIQAAGQARFASLAAFSSDDSLILTAAGGSSPGELQLWEAPKARGRGFERVRLVTPGRTPVTCAAFGSDAEKKFVVVGTATGGIYAWTPPSEKEARTLTGTVESVLNYNDKAALLRVRVVNPPADLLQDRGTANVVIDPDAVASVSTPSMTVPVFANPPAAAPVTPAVATTPVSPAPNLTLPVANGTGLGSPASTVSPGILPPIPPVPDPKKP